MVKLADFNKEYNELKDEIDREVLKVLDSGSYIMGKDVRELEAKLSNYLGMKAYTVASGTDALLIALRAASIGHGDEVITTPFTFVATASTITFVGAKPVFVDIDEETFNINPKLIEEKITQKTKAILPVHLFGHSADMDEILRIAKKYNLLVIEDNAQAFGSFYKGKKTGSIGDISALSFFPTKNLGAYGDGGAVFAKDEEICEKIDMLRSHGSKKKYLHEIIGYNSRLDTIQAAILNVKLKYFEDFIEKKRKLASIYLEELKGVVKLPVEKENCYHTYHQFTIRVKNRDELSLDLSSNNIQSAVHYPLPLHLQKAFNYLGYKEGSFPVAERVSKEVLSLPIFHTLSEEEIYRVCQVIKNR
ncbi:DegT/DnrJ/EryC1/StrS aminotransferase [Thermodesulfobium narugense DSM 14796]|uniref:DegT/DnrJ/EryC1/StrS aminotransferase n=1 Tax=Thermodesulfobium narugense DSM 14796 TaxID=747365 RepID=M1E772_9BACT|nr:DegT/DnrJ/EryC1/StrS family aminotransferase [Thermodesulfobium narugense]AEE13849.1 DegT/DnrJ/EryC1/StrS aminotransferase [Thermodesulfobium narugense DSM 14796]